jgi:uncharacterized protein YcbX
VSEQRLRLASLHIHPVKSCAGLRVPHWTVADTGFRFDRQWMVVDADGRLFTQRQDPRMALIRPTLAGDALLLDAPGMPTLHLPFEAPGPARRVQVWSDDVSGIDQGDAASQWLADVLQAKLRLVRFDTSQPRTVDPRWTGEHRAHTMFADGYPFLVASTAGIEELNRRLAERGLPAVGVERFRPNLVIDGLDPHGEDFLDELRFDTPQGPVVVKLVKPCVRCTIPSVDPATGVQGHEPGDTLSSYRADARMNGGITFGMNAILLEGTGLTLAEGMEGEATIAF